MQKEKIGKLKLAFIFFIIGFLGTMADSIGFLIYLYQYNIGLFEFSGVKILSGYFKSIVGIILTILWLVPFIISFILFQIESKKLK